MSERGATVTTQTHPGDEWDEWDEWSEAQLLASVIGGRFAQRQLDESRAALGKTAQVSRARAGLPRLPGNAAPPHRW